MLIDWINDELADFRIIVKDLEEDLFDGQILQKLIGISLFCLKQFVALISYLCEIFAWIWLHLRFWSQIAYSTGRDPLRSCNI